MLVNERGISFEPTEDYLRTLKNVGAEDVLQGALRGAKQAKAEALSAEVAVKREQVQKHLAQGSELAEKKLYAEAAQEYRGALQSEPDNPDLKFALGYVLGEQKKWDLAAAEFRTALRLQPDYAEARINLGGARTDPLIFIACDLPGVSARFFAPQSLLAPRHDPFTPRPWRA